MQKAGIVEKAPARVKRKPCAPTYDRWILTRLVPAAGWQGVFYDDGTHELIPVHVLALGHRRRYEVHTGRVVPSAWPGREDEAWEIVALAYDVADGWTVLDESSNFCGLVPPNMALAEFEQVSLCRWEHAAPRRQAAACHRQQQLSGGTPDDETRRP